MHSKAFDMERPAITASQLLKSTPFRNAIASAPYAKTAKVTKLIDIEYMVAKEEMPVTKYPCIVELEKNHGVASGTAYSTEKSTRISPAPSER